MLDNIIHVWVGYIFMKSAANIKSIDNKQYPIFSVSACGAILYMYGIIPVFCLLGSVYCGGFVSIEIYYIILCIIVVGIVLDVIRYNKFCIPIKKVFGKLDSPALFIDLFDIVILIFLIILNAAR